MTTVTVSPKYQVVIPLHVREALGIRPGQKLQVLQYQSRVELVPERSIRDARGLLKGMSTDIRRDPDRT